MKDIRTRISHKNVKKLERHVQLLKRTRASVVQFKQKEKEEPKSRSPVEYAKSKSNDVVKRSMRVGGQLTRQFVNRVNRTVLIEKSSLLKDIERKGSGQKQSKVSIVARRKASKNNTSGGGQTRSIQSPLSLKQIKVSTSHTRYKESKYTLLRPIQGKSEGALDTVIRKQSDLEGRANARLLYMGRVFKLKLQPTKQQKSSNIPAENKKQPPANSIHRSYVRRMTTVEQQSGDVQRKIFRAPLSSQFVKKPNHSQSVRYSFNGKGRKIIKTLSKETRTGAFNRQKGNRSASVQQKGGMEQAKQAVYQAALARRNLQRIQAMTRFNLRILRIVVKAAALAVKGIMALLGVSGSVIMLMCIILAVAYLIASPYGIFFSDENTDNDVKPLSVIVQEMDAEFTDRLEEIRQNEGSVDREEINYLGSADNTRVDNWSDIIAVFAVKTAMDTENGMDVVTIDATRVEAIRSVFWDMNQIEYDIETIEHEETVALEQEDGSLKSTTVTTYETVLHITITSRTAEEQSTAYSFTNDQDSLMKELLSEEFRPLMFALLGKDGDTGLSQEELDLVYRDLPEGEHGVEAVKLALTRLGDPYSQPKAGMDRYTDCSYLVQWVYKQLNIQLPRTAAEQARYIVDNNLAIQYENLAPGDLVFWSYERNGRFMDITHVGIYAGNGQVVDASSSRGQVVYRNLFDGDKQVIYGRVR
ncbi:C40 family peptidase [Paenibacillus agaridevorans]|uniref:C40 family peptidase n=1 Tax=Paenibacillus agaridevorans TaxID=171404 RepID=UPI001BE49EFD|nr:C40 family peptidase [Paenibacillus agaridevorans]